jgi:crotonobetainyl-CoA:carnitine CoA-transferase CaiB-like acyl-CoA transferase
MFESLLQSVLGEHLGGYTFVPQLGPGGYRRMLTRFRRPYETQDGYVCALIYNDKHWKAFFEMVGRAELAADPRFASAEGRSQNFDDVYSFVADEMARQTTAHWLEALERADIPVQRMNSLEDILKDPHLAAIGYFTPVEHPSEGTLLSMKVPSEWSETKPELRRPAPRFGEHTREVLKEAGYGDEAIEAMAKSGAARL